MELPYIDKLDRDLRDFASTMYGTTLSTETLQAYRQQVLYHAKTSVDADLDVTIDKQTLSTEAGEVDVLLFNPHQSQQRRPVYLYMHGGGTISGGAHLDNQNNARLAHDLDCLVVSIDYHLAPETVFPGQLNECYGVLKWVVQHADALYIDVSRIAIGGSSAGGLLSASLAQLAQDRHEINIVFQNLHIPMLDIATTYQRPTNPYVGHYGWTYEMNAFAWQQYLGEAFEKTTLPPYAVPAQRQDVSQLPATLITVGSLDLFVDEAIQYAQRLIQAGVSTELHVYPGLFHLGELIPEARVARQIYHDRVNALKRAFYD